MKMRLLKFVLAFLFLLQVCVNAVPITIEITGSITSVSGSGVPGTIHTGCTFTGAYIYDSAAIDTSPYSEAGLYVYDSPYGINIVLEGYTFKTASNHIGQFDMLILNDDPTNGVKDAYGVRSWGNVSIPFTGFNMGSIFWYLNDGTHTALSSTDLPLIAPTLQAWANNQLTISGYDSFGHGFSIYGTVTQAVLIPEPLTDILMTIGVFLFHRRR